MKYNKQTIDFLLLLFSYIQRQNADNYIIRELYWILKINGVNFPDKVSSLFGIVGNITHNVNYETAVEELRDFINAIEQTE